MSTLTTMFVVGPEEYVEFNESMGSKAFVEHIWDQSRRPLTDAETSASGTFLHSAGARLSSSTPPVIEFPTVNRIKGKGNTYKSTGNWISWEDLKKKNPLAVLDPPSLEEYINRGTEVGRGEKIEAGGLLKGERRFKVVKRKKDSAPSSSDVRNTWTGGSSQSVYATSSTLGSDHTSEQCTTRSPASTAHRQEGSLEPDRDGWFRGSSSSTSSSRTRTSKDKRNSSDNYHSDSLGVATVPVRQLRKSRSGLSLSERLGMDELKEASNAEPMPGAGMDEAPTMKEDRRLNLHLANLTQTPSIGKLNSPIAQTPLSAYHSPPETPLKHIGRGDNKQADLPATPGSEQAVYDTIFQHASSSRVGGLLLESEGDSPVFPKELQMSKRDTLPLGALRGTAGTANGSPSQIDAMLAKLKLARTGAGTQESRWAVKEPETSIKAKDEKAVESKPSTEKPIVDKPTLEPVRAQISLPATLTAPRALREKKVVRETSPPAKSLLERMTTAAVGETSAPVKSKKDKKRGVKNAEVNHERSTSNTKAKVEDNAPSKTSCEVSAIVPLRLDSPVTAPKDPILDPQPQASDAISPSLVPSTSAASVTTNHTTEGSTVGNDTWSTINWADDDDDLPELPVEWMRAASLATSNATNGDDPRSNAAQLPVVETNSAAYINGNAQRGAKRASRGRGKKDRQVTPTPLAPRGIKIAGSAAQANRDAKQAAPKELFPMHKQDNIPRVNNAPREQRLHGRPKLMSSNKETFGRLTKGALGVSSTPSPAIGSNQAPPRK